MMRTYAGHSTAQRSNELYRGNLAKGQTGLSVAFDLPTQTGYDADHELARGEVGKVGVPIAHKGDMHALMDGIPLDRMNTSMTINATAAWLLALYIVVAEENGIAPAVLQGTTQNDIIKEYLSRGTYAFPPAPSMRLIADMVAYTIDEVPKWNPINVCSYHLQEAGATPVQEIAYAMATAQRGARRGPPARRRRTRWARSSGASRSSSTPASASSRSTRSCGRWASCGRSWGASATASTDERHLRFRYGVQVNSLGLTESQPENNVQRIVLEALAVTMGRNARARAMQLPAWNEALGLPRPWDQQWSLRIQQVLAYETDLLEYPDIFEGSVVMDGLVAELLEGARAEMARVAEQGGAVEAVPYMKSALVESHRERIARIEAGEQVLVGVNRYQETAPSPLTADAEGGILVVDPAVEAGPAGGAGGVARVARRGRRAGGAGGARPRGRSPTRTSCPPRSPPPARARRPASGRRRCATPSAPTARPTGVGEAAAPAPGEEIAALRDDVAALSEALGRNLKILVGKPGLDGHSNGAEQIAVRARDAGMEVVYEGIRLTPSQIARSAVDEGVHVIGLSILSGSHRELIPDVIEALREAGGDGHPARRRRDHPRGRRRAAARGRRGRGLHPEGLRAQPDPARRRRARGGAERHRDRRVSRRRYAGVSASAEPPAPSSARGCARAT